MRFRLREGADSRPHGVCARGVAAVLSKAAYPSLRQDVENVLAARGWREVRQIGGATVREEYCRLREQLNCRDSLPGEGSFAKALLVEASDGTQAVCKAASGKCNIQSGLIVPHAAGYGHLPGIQEGGPGLSMVLPRMMFLSISQAEAAAKAGKRDACAGSVCKVHKVQEGRLLASLRHPFVVRYRDSFCEAGRLVGNARWELSAYESEAGMLCIIMDFCEGGMLWL